MLQCKRDCHRLKLEQVLAYPRELCLNGRLLKGCGERGRKVLHQECAVLEKDEEWGDLMRVGHPRV